MYLVTLLPSKDSDTRFNSTGYSMDRNLSKDCSISKDCSVSKDFSVSKDSSGFLFQLKFYSPVNPLGPYQGQPVNLLSTLLLGRLSPLSS